MTDLSLPGVQSELLDRLAGVDTPVVVVLVSGKPHTMPWADDHEAVAHAWLPGEEGGSGLADVLFGDFSPSGRLPVSIPKHVGQVPVHYARRPNTRTERHVYVDSDPQYPFGYGRTYTDFEFGDLTLSTERMAPAGTVTATTTVENVGDVSGHEVVQLYVHEETPTLARPVQELVGFERVELEPGESARVSFTLSASQLASHDLEMNLRVPEGDVEFRVGRSAADIRSTATLSVSGSRVVPRSGRSYFTETDVE